VLHVYDDKGNEFARGRQLVLAKETILLARNPEMEIEDVIRLQDPKRDCRVGKHPDSLRITHLQIDAPKKAISGHLGLTAPWTAENIFPPFALNWARHFHKKSG